ncbi:hypothetical protein GCM10027594_12760 [Hymenobacter agri]
MDNWLLYLLIAVALGGGVYALSRPLPLDYKNGEYRRHLTRAEKATLAAGQPVEKIHKAYQSIWHTYYDQGPLRITPGPNGTYRFAPHGEWKRLKTTGEVEATFTPGNKPGLDYWHQLRPDGQPDYDLYSVPTVLAGDSVIEGRIVYFRWLRPTDTAYVTHFYRRGNKEVGKQFNSFDAAGKRPVPPGWQATR